MRVLDVGQGLSVVVRTRNHAMLYDTGARFSRDFDAGSAVVVPYLRHQGIDTLDLLVISHGDNDHIGGMPAVLDAVRVRSTSTSVPDRVPGSRPCVAGEEWIWDGVRFTVLSPSNANPLPHNNASCVVRISGRFGTALLTGDIEKEAEMQLIHEFGEALRSDILLVPHQGSKTSSLARFIDLVAPAFAIVSAGYLNRYGHPAADVVQRYRERDIQLFDTSRHGAVHARVTRDGIALEVYRQSHKRVWFSAQRHVSPISSD